MPPAVVLITGCSTGLGRALAAECAAAVDERGAPRFRVFASARRPSMLADLPPQVERVALDVQSDACVHEAVQQVLAAAGRIDVLAVAPAMVAQRSGLIVNIGSVMSWLVTPWAAAYCASKQALLAVSQALRMELAPFGVEVAHVTAGAIQSRIAEKASFGIERYEAPSSLYHACIDGIRARADASQARAVASRHGATARAALLWHANRLSRTPARRLPQPPACRAPAAPLLTCAQDPAAAFTPQRTARQVLAVVLRSAAAGAAPKQRRVAPAWFLAGGKALFYFAAGLVQRTVGWPVYGMMASRFGLSALAAPRGGGNKAE
eukprot:scaffold7.g3709.t1